jgi:hypothetical protein
MSEYTVQINGVEQKKLLSFFAATYHTQPSNDLKNFIAKCKKEGKHKCFVYPSYGKFDWVHNSEVFHVEFYEEGEAKACSESIEFLIRMYISHDNLNKIKGFVEDAFNYVAEIENVDKDKVKLYVSKCNVYCSS